VEIIVDSKFYSIPKAPKEGINPKGTSKLAIPLPLPPLLSPFALRNAHIHLPPSLPSLPTRPADPPIHPSLFPFLSPSLSGFKGTVASLKFTAKNGVTCSANRPVVVKVWRGGGREGGEGWGKEGMWLCQPARGREGREGRREGGKEGKWLCMGRESAKAGEEGRRKRRERDETCLRGRMRQRRYLLSREDGLSR